MRLFGSVIVCRAASIGREPHYDGSALRAANDQAETGDMLLALLHHALLILAQGNTFKQRENLINRCAAVAFMTHCYHVIAFEGCATLFQRTTRPSQT
jgi:hypothetical protein